MAETETFQHYQVLKHPDGTLWELGRGAMGVTYKAFDTNLRCQVALKVINATYLDSDMARQRFLREARAAAGLSHPNVASVFHLGEEGGNYFYAMEFINGETLEAFVRRRGPLPPAVALRITLQVARALRAASREGLVHRDIKPANLMLLHEEDAGQDPEDDDLHVKVIDFGLAKVSHKDGPDASATLTTAGFVGTPHFASPEQLEEKSLDVRSDIYSLGVTLWYMLTGRPPFSGGMVQIMSQHLTRTPPFAQLEGVPPAVVRLLERMLEKDAARRPQTATDLRREIEAAGRTLRAEAGPGTVGPGMGGGGNGGTEAPVDSSFPTQAFTESEARSTGGHHAPTAEPATGVVLAGRYRILRTVADGTHGTLFQALELDHGRPVALKVLKPGTLAAPEEFQRAETAVTRTRAARHPSLLEIYSLERAGTHVFVTSEWVNGFTLVDLLRNRGALPLDETLRCLEPLAAAADHARQAGLPELDFSPAQVLLAFEATLDLPGLSSLMGTPLTVWPAFRPKVYPLSLHFDTQASAPTAAGLQTIVPVDHARPGAIRQLAGLVYELLGGSPVAQNAKGPRPPLAALSERGNAVLRQALSSEAPASFQTAGAMIVALRDSSLGESAVAGTMGRPNALSKAVSMAPLTPTAVPLPIAPPTLSPAPPPLAPQPTRGPMLLVVLLLVGFTVLGIIGGLSFAAWKIFVVADAGTHQGQDADSHRRATPRPTVEPTPVATPTATPLPTSTPRPTPPTDHASRAKEMLAQATTLERQGDDTGALAAYAQVAEDYPEADPGLSRLDSFISRLRSQPSSGPDETARQLQRFRAPMEQSARLGSDAAMVYLGDHLLSTDPTAAAEWYRQAAAKGQPEAMLALGDMSFRGVGVPLEPAQAARWYQLASDKGFAKAKVYLAECYELGKAGLPRNYDKSFQLLNEALAIEPNNAAASEKLAEEYERGRGTTPDTSRAFTLMKRAADLGSIPALGNLGVYYMRGVGQRADPRAAVGVFKQGVAKNNAACMFFYAQCLEKGLGGVMTNADEATSYYRAAAERGFPPARDWCNQHRVGFVPASAPSM